MDLSRKLDRLDRARSVLATFAPKPLPPPPRIPLSEQLAAFGEPRPPRFKTIETILDPDHVHGRVPVSRAKTQSPALLAALALDPRLAEVDFSRALFLDTETTGLSGGTGTLAFLIGLARFVDDCFQVEQLLLLEPGAERPMLEMLRDRIAASSCLVTFNGKTFDMPLLNTRFVLERLALPPPLPHLDLLHCARRVYKKRLREVRLVRLEEQVLGMRRDRDVDGSEIPGLYWSFVRSGSHGVLAPVIEHNANDLVALAALMVRMGERFATVCKEDDPLDHYSMAQVALRAGDPPRALAFALAAAYGGGTEEISARALELAARIELERGELDLALSRLEEASVLGGAEPLLSSALHLRLAKLYEHKKKDYARAAEHARFTLLAEGEVSHERRGLRISSRAKRLTLLPSSRSSRIPLRRSASSRSEEHRTDPSAPGT
jgi:uncharacterized protein YprB with RNaseH-like and TPR domain